VSSDNTDIEHLIAAADALPAPAFDDDTEHHATLTILRTAPDHDGAMIALAALGLTDPYAPLPGIPDAGPSTRRHPAGTTHGTRAAVGWHREQRILLCVPCQRWADADDRIRAMKTGS